MYRAMAMSPLTVMAISVLVFAGLGALDEDVEDELRAVEYLQVCCSIDRADLPR